MPFNRPTLAELRSRTSADIERYGEDKASRRGDVLFPLAQAHAGASHALHGHLAWIAEQMFDDSADEANLLRRSAPYGITRIAAVAASGTIDLSGSEGATVPAETLLQDDQGQVFRTTALATIAAGVATAPVVALEPGVAGNLAAATKLTFLSPLAGIDSSATVAAAGLAGGADIETIERVRERLAERKQKPPMGGNPDDYIAWAKAAHVDITRAWCYPNELGIGSVVVRFVTDDLATPIPTQAHVDSVTSYTDGVRPAGMKQFVVYAPAAKALNLTFSKLTPNTPAVQAAIAAELADLISREGTPGGTLLLSHINEAISLATGETDHAHDLAADFVCATGEFPVVGALTWPAP